MAHSSQRFVERDHPDDRLDPAKQGRPGTIRRVRVNACESPVDWLHARGQLSDRQRDAATRLRQDYERAALAPAVTMRWDSAVGASGTRRGAASAPDLSAAQIDAKRRFHGAIDAAGKGLADILWRVVCAGEGMAYAEKGLGWPVRSGRLVLGIALDRVADAYHLR